MKMAVFQLTLVSGSDTIITDLTLNTGHSNTWPKLLTYIISTNQNKGQTHTHTHAKNQALNWWYIKTN